MRFGVGVLGEAYPHSSFMVLGFEVHDLGFRVLVLGYRGFQVSGLEFRVYGLRFGNRLH